MASSSPGRTAPTDRTPAARRPVLPSARRPGRASPPERPPRPQHQALPSELPTDRRPEPPASLPSRQGPQPQRPGSEPPAATRPEYPATLAEGSCSTLPPAAARASSLPAAALPSPPVQASDGPPSTAPPERAQRSSDVPAQALTLRRNLAPRSWPRASTSQQTAPWQAGPTRPAAGRAWSAPHRAAVPPPASAPRESSPWAPQGTNRARPLRKDRTPARLPSKGRPVLPGPHSMDRRTSADTPGDASNVATPRSRPWSRQGPLLRARRSSQPPTTSAYPRSPRANQETRPPCAAPAPILIGRFQGRQSPAAPAG